MKKFIAIALVLVAVLALFTACSKANCTECGKEVSGDLTEVEFMGEKGQMCDDCFKEYQQAVSDLGSAMDELDQVLNDLDAAGELG